MNRSKSKLDITEEGINKLEDTAAEIIQNAKQRNKEMLGNMNDAMRGLTHRQLGSRRKEYRKQKRDIIQTQNA